MHLCDFLIRHVGDECPTGHYCPLGTTLPLACVPGQFNFITSKQYIISITRPDFYYLVDSTIGIKCMEVVDEIFVA